MVSVTFLSGLPLNGAASTTNRLGTSCACDHLFSTLRLGIVTHAAGAGLVDDFAAEGHGLHGVCRQSG